MITLSRWTTSSFGDMPDSSPLELSVLQDHVHVCKGLRGRWFSVRCRAEAFHGFVAARFVTSLALTMGLVGVLVWIL